MKNKDILKEEDYNNFFDLQRLLYIWGKNNIHKIFDTGISLIPKLGRPLNEIIKLIRDFLKFKNQVEKGEKGDIEKFLENIGEKKIAETDYLSEIIKEKVEEQKDEKESILILDDIDRTDPEQIFRILNVFSAHFDLQNNELPNKFGFDKVIIVADFSNLQSIFHHKYGIDTDSSGYFSKFFSVDIFQFKNEEIIAEVIDKVILKFQSANLHNLEDAIKHSNGYIRHILRDILTRSLELTGEEKLNMWQLLKGIRFSLPALNDRDRIKYNREEDAPIYQSIDISIRTLISIFNGIDANFILVLKKIKENLNEETAKQKHIYRLYSFYLLKKFKDFETEIDPKGKILWKQYEIIISPEKNKIESILTKQNNSPLFGELFYDLLIDYVKQGLYNFSPIL